MRIKYGSNDLKLNGSNSLKPNGSSGLEQELMYDLCMIAYFPYKGKEPTKLIHMSCFFNLKGPHLVSMTSLQPSRPLSIT